MTSPSRENNLNTSNTNDYEAGTGGIVQGTPSDVMSDHLSNDTILDNMSLTPTQTEMRNGNGEQNHFGNIRRAEDLLQKATNLNSLLSTNLKPQFFCSNFFFNNTH
jgi:hypothetical protein